MHRARPGVARMLDLTLIADCGNSTAMESETSVDRHKESAAEKQAEQQNERDLEQIAARYKRDPDVTTAQAEYANCLKYRGYLAMTGDAEAFEVYLQAYIQPNNEDGQD
jgi:hypothetical protein